MDKALPVFNGILEACVMLVLFCLPFSKSIVEIFVVLSIALFLVKKILIDRNFQLKMDKKALALLILFVTFNIISLANSQYPDKSVPAIFSKTIKWALFFVAAAETIRTKEQARRIFRVMLFSCALILADAFWQQYVTGKDFLHYPRGYPVFKFHGRSVGSTTFPTASFPFPNDFATWINVYLFTFLSAAIFGLKKSPFLRVIAGVFCVMLAFFLFLTTTGGALLAAISAVSVLILINIKKLLVPVAIILIAAGLAVSFIPYLNTYLKEGVLSKALSIGDRKMMWTAGYRIFKQHPFLGSGVNTFFEHFKYFREDEDKYTHGSYAHNCMLQMAADIGIFGLLSFLGFSILVLFKNARRALRNLGEFKNSIVLGLSLGMITFLVHSVFDTNLYSLNLAALFWLGMGVIEGMGSGHGDLNP